MHQILVYADSLDWGIIPDTRERFAFDKRWPGVMENELQSMGFAARVVEDCLNGQRTAWDDPCNRDEPGGWCSSGRGSARFFGQGDNPESRLVARENLT